MFRRCMAWAETPHGRHVIALKLVISGCMLAVFFHPALGQALGAGGSLLWLWVKMES